MVVLAAKRTAITDPTPFLIKLHARMQQNANDDVRFTKH
jgi:hypothetical protein